MAALALPFCMRSLTFVQSGSSRAAYLSACAPMRSGLQMRALSAITAGSSDEVVLSFDHVKSGLNTLFKFWMMGACGGADGWQGVGQLTAGHAASGMRVSLHVDTEAATLRIVPDCPMTSATQKPYTEFVRAVLAELEDLASTEEAAPSDRLVYPPESARRALEMLEAME
eukprot:TRINITY_DN53814_c0_g1_i1.p1 TRINITY_DN53814_c0_g1~~TRINITY_DN53814_c0_g1_i1.p1  ORF type:complete len:192 (+),score=36.47 TRINITY_DN53814_c0_g1_i1:68-577(+)